MKTKIFFLSLIMFLFSCARLPLKQEGQHQFKGFVFSMQTDDGYWQIWRCNLDGENLTQLTHSEIDKRYPFVSSDNRVIFVTNDGKLFTTDINGSNLKQIPLKIKITQSKPSNLGNKIIFTSFYNEFDENSDIWMFDLGKTGRDAINHVSTALTKIIRRPWMQLDPTFMDDETILFVDAPELTGYEIYKFNLENNNAIQITQNNFYDITPVFDKNTRKIAFASDRDKTFDIWIMDEFGQEQKNLTKDNYDDKSPYFSSSGDSIYFLSDKSGRHQIYKINLKNKKSELVFSTERDILDFVVCD